jgi:nucleolar protein 14
MSKRLLPEAINLVASSLLILLPRRKDAKTPLFPDIEAPDADLKISSAAEPTEPVNLGRALTDDATNEIKADLIAVALRLISTFAAMYSSTPAFIEIFTPVLVAVEGSRVPKQSSALKVSLNTFSH